MPGDVIGTGGIIISKTDLFPGLPQDIKQVTSSKYKLI